MIFETSAISFSNHFLPSPLTQLSSAETNPILSFRSNIVSGTIPLKVLRKINFLSPFLYMNFSGRPKVNSISLKSIKGTRDSIEKAIEFLSSYLNKEGNGIFVTCLYNPSLKLEGHFLFRLFDLDFNHLGGYCFKTLYLSGKKFNSLSGI